MAVRILVAGSYLGPNLKKVKRQAGDLHEGPGWYEQELVASALAKFPAPETVSVETVEEPRPEPESEPEPEPKPRARARKRNPFVEG